MGLTDTALAWGLAIAVVVLAIRYEHESRIRSTCYAASLNPSTITEELAKKCGFRWRRQ